MNIDTRYINQIEVIISLFTVVNGKIKVLLVKREEEPFKNYWYLPSNLLMTVETIEECAKETIFDFTNFDNIYLEQCNVFSKVDRLPNDRIIANSLIGIVPGRYVPEHKYPRGIECNWFDIEDIPKTVYDHATILQNAANYLKKEIMNHRFTSLFLEEDFTLPELQSIYECANGKRLDRRNFRKSMIETGKIIDSGKKAKPENGRPPKLYRFNI